MATFRKRGSKWQVQVRLQGHQALTRTFTFKADAEQWARQTEASIERGESQGQEDKLSATTLQELLDRYGRTVTPAKKGSIPEASRLNVLSRSAISGLTLDKLTPAEISSYRDQRLLQVSSPTVRRELVVLRHCLEVARREWGVDLPENPVARITMPQHGRSRDRRITLCPSSNGLRQLAARFKGGCGSSEG
jgi:hypothetical protein